MSFNNQDEEVVTLRSQEQRQKLLPKPVVVYDQDVDEDEIDQLDELVATRNNEIRALQTRVHEVNGLFRQVADIVANSAPVVDSIVTHVQTASSHTEQGKKEIEKAAKTQEETRTNTAILAGVGTTVGVVAILAIFFGLKH